MKISYKWLQDYFDDTLPSAEEIGNLLTMHAFEVESVEKIGDDSVLDVKVLPDRSHDALSHRGIAQEVSVHAKIPLKPEFLTLQEIHVPESNVLKAEILDTKLCKRISLLVMEQVEVKESPAWLKERLEAIGQRSINNIVDATNYVMLSIGQPLHAYDRNLLTEDSGEWKIIVRKAREGESVLALDNKEYPLQEDELVIADGNEEKALGIAGIKGGKASEISAQTRDIILEAANFEPVNIRKTAKKLGLRTDASVRFENEITPELTLAALKQVSDLIVTIAGTEKTQIEGMIDVYPRPAHPYKIGVSLAEIQSVLGIEISKKEIESILTLLNFSFEYLAPFKCIEDIARTQLNVPYKLGASVVYDSGKFFDCSSFTAYVYSQVGFSIPRISVDQFVYGTPVSQAGALPGDLVFSNTEEGKIYTESVEWMKGTSAPQGVDHVGIYLGNDTVIHATRKAGFVITEQLSASASFKTIVGLRRMGSDEARFVVSVPSERLDIRLKEDLIDDIVKVYGYTHISSKKILPLSGNVEIEKKTYYSDVLRDFFVSEGYSEVITYAFRNAGSVELQNPLAKDRAFLRADLADGLTESFTLNDRNKDLLGITETRLFEIGNVFTEGGEYTAVAFVGGKKEHIEAKIGELLGTPLSFVTTEKVNEANFEHILADLPSPQTPPVAIESVVQRYKPFSAFPFMVRDIAVFVPVGEEENILEIAHREAGSLLVHSRLFDTFTKEFPEGKKTSYAYRLIFQSMDRTLTDEEINPIMQSVTDILNSKAGWQVR